MTVGGLSLPPGSLTALRGSSGSNRGAPVPSRLSSGRGPVHCHGGWGRSSRSSALTWGWGPCSSMSLNRCRNNRH